MNSISCRTRERDVRVNPVCHFPNYRSEKVNGEVKLIECEPVAIALASDFSLQMNALRNERCMPRSRRITCDAVDLVSELTNYTE